MSGKYTCIGTSHVGRFKREIEVIVEVPQVELSQLEYDKMYQNYRKLMSVKQGENIVLSCPVVSNKKVYWYKIEFIPRLTREFIGNQPTIVSFSF